MKRIKNYTDLRPGMIIRVRAKESRKSIKYLVVEIPFNTDGVIYVRRFAPWRLGKLKRDPGEKVTSLCLGGMGIVINDLTPIPSTPKERWLTVVVP